MCGLTVVLPNDLHRHVTRDTLRHRTRTVTYVSPLPQRPVFLPFSHPDSAKEGDGAELTAASGSFEAKRAGFLHCDQQFLIKHGVGRIRRQVQAVEAGMSPDRDTPAEC